jgi:pimeloyl-ACP methyl ester carboxylesterase
MPFAVNGDIRICYDVVGDLADPPLLLIAGLGNQLVMWHDEFCLSLVDRGFCIIRFDNRDCGLSTVLADDAVYGLADMAADAVAVLDELGVERAHVFGQSMGGMIAQVLAIEYPQRVASLTLVSTSTGNPEFGKATHEALAAIGRPPPDDIETAIEHDLANRRIWASPGWFDEEVAREQFRAAYERAFTPGGALRQFAAIAMAPDREAALRTLCAPTLVLHGTLDPLISIDGGERLAELVPDAELLPVEGLAHDLPVQVWQQVISALTTHVSRHAA